MVNNNSKNLSHERKREKGREGKGSEGEGNRERQ
jgi:hypothetical protein